MRKLLEELKTIDPVCYEEIVFGLEQVDIEYEEDIIQGACQRAIAARKMYCSMTIAGSPILEVAVDGKKYVQRTTSTAKAILSAYLSAIRSQP